MLGRMDDNRDGTVTQSEFLEFFGKVMQGRSRFSNDTGMGQLRKSAEAHSRMRRARANAAAEARAGPASKKTLAQRIEALESGGHSAGGMQDVSPHLASGILFIPLTHACCKQMEACHTRTHAGMCARAHMQAHKCVFLCVHACSCVRACVNACVGGAECVMVGETGSCRDATTVDGERLSLWQLIYANNTGSTDGGRLLLSRDTIVHSAGFTTP